MASSSARNGNRKTPQGKYGANESPGTHQRSVQGWAEHLETPWDTPRLPPVAIRLGRACAPQGKRRLAAFCCTDLQATPAQILEWVVMRWSVQAIVEEARTHLGVETIQSLPQNQQI